MNEKKKLPKIFANVNIRTIWDSEKNDYYWIVKE